MFPHFIMLHCNQWVLFSSRCVWHMEAVIWYLLTFVRGISYGDIYLFPLKLSCSILGSYLSNCTNTLVPALRFFSSEYSRVVNTLCYLKPDVRFRSSVCNAGESLQNFPRVFRLLYFQVSSTLERNHPSCERAGPASSEDSDLH